MSRPSKKHHFVPQAQLRHFAADTERRFLFVFDKQSDRSYHTSILNAGSENDFNTISLGDSKWNFEDLFQLVDAQSARLVAEIVSRRSLAWLTLDDRVTLADFFATQLLRTHFSRTTPKRVAEQLRQMMRQIGYDPDRDPDMAMPTDTTLRLGAVKAFLNRGGHAATLLRLTPALYATGGEYRFIISDHPVGCTNAFPYGGRGLTSQGILVLLPISPDLTIALHCPTIVQRYKLVASADLEPERRARMLRYRDGLLSAEPIEVDDDVVLNLNRRQVAQCTRYLYAPTDAFDFAREFLKEHPELRTVDTHLKMGEMGHAPPPNPRLPAGTHLVILGQTDHCMLAIDEIDGSGEGITARTRQVDLLAQVAADTSMLQAELYVDGQPRRGMGQAMIECFGEPSSGWFRVVHRDPGLRALSTQLDAKLR
ncbi:DUF4238 domain-containing protein [Siccirubricoccus sp. KC 17139]|uniref:DUF4238 domain-containing protein n=1 Tax=Siccirubricoccus soli TaxID=2899147 RepID=A0ABT1D1K8_9PROT|nr:DUF4238 domain-containing protein [Siccirubricoccus soli]MCO6415796.1 DUF4238 domain-containing protein [Siccirubricoccus soli]MCP2681928.1 DUF4238 domain-containing protein [Siccirubricoccus soli]